MRVSLVAGSGQVGNPGAQLPLPLTTRVTDPSGNPLANTRVTFSVISGGGTIEGAEAITNEMGIAVSGLWTLGRQSGVQQVKAESGSASVLLSAFACTDCDKFQLLFSQGGDIYRLSPAGPIALAAGYAPAWSATGRIAIERFEQSIPSVYITDEAGDELAWIGGAHSPAWSPNGRRIAVAYGYVYYGSVKVFDMSADGTRLSLLYEVNQAAAPAWSPDGNRIAFVRLSGDDGYHALVIMTADGSEQAQLTPIDGSALDHPTWSPDGQRIAFTRCEYGVCDVYVVGADGTGFTQLTHTGMVETPAWSPDGKFIAVTLRDLRSIALIPIADSLSAPPSIIARGSDPAWRR
jgi:Tol biopolymer transport system component